MTKNREKNEKIKAQNGLHRIMSQLSDDTKKLTKNREKDSKIIFGSKWKKIMSQLLDYTKKLRFFFGSALSEANNELTFRIH